MGWQVNLQHIEPANSFFFCIQIEYTVQEVVDISSINDLVIVIIECIPSIG